MDRQLGLQNSRTVARRMVETDAAGKRSRVLDAPVQSSSARRKVPPSTRNVVSIPVESYGLRERVHPVTGLSVPRGLARALTVAKSERVTVQVTEASFAARATLRYAAGCSVVPLNLTPLSLQCLTFRALGNRSAPTSHAGLQEARRPRLGALWPPLPQPPQRCRPCQPAPHHPKRRAAHRTRRVARELPPRKRPGWLG
jgi:hypothetical protein